MPADSHSNYQKKVISDYYNNIDTIMLHKLSDLVTELYLCRSTKKKEKLWERAEKAMKNLKVRPAIINHIMSKKDPRILAENLKDWLHPKK